MKYIALLMVIIMTLFGCATIKRGDTDKNVYDKTSLTVLTINLMVDKEGFTKKERLEMMVDYLMTLPDPVDIILIQEGSDTLFSRNTISELKSLLGDKNLYYDEVYRSCTTLVIRPFFNVLVGVLSRYDVKKYSYQNLNANANGDLLEKFVWSKRPMVKITINHPTFGPVNIFSVHFSGTDPEVQCDKLLAFSLSNDKTIIGGDFNFGKTSKGYTILSSKFKPTGDKIDHIFYDDRLELVYVRTLFDGTDGPIISDHYGVLTKFKLK